MIRERVIPVAWLLAAAVIVGAAWGAGAAKADPRTDYGIVNADAICATLDAYPTPAGVLGIGQAIVADGYLSFYQAGEAIGVAVAVECPRHQPVLDRFTATYAPVSRRLI